MENNITLKIAEIIIQMQSKFSLLPLDKKERMDWRFKGFLYKGNQKPDILINIEIVNKLTEIKGLKDIFTTTHFQDRDENWQLSKIGKDYIYKSLLEGKKQLMRVNRDFNQVDAYLLPKEEKTIIDDKEREFVKNNNGLVWSISDIIYVFLEVLLINYFAQRKQGIFTHSLGVKDLDGKGLLFSGKSGCGKTTLARLWDRHSRAMVLNDDRIIIRKKKKDFFIYSSPWHGDFSDYLMSRIEEAKLEKLFFIYHSQKNQVKPLAAKEAFSLLYPAIFPTFWDREGLENIVSFCHDLVRNVSCFRMGFIKDRGVIEFIRGIK